MIDAEHAHPSVAYLLLLWPWLGVESHRIMQSAGYYMDGRHVAHIAPVHLGTHISYVVLYLPDAFARTSPVPEKLDGAGVTLRIVGTDQTQQGALASSVLSAQRPFLAFAHGPVEVAQNGAAAVADVHAVELQYLPALLGIEVFRVERPFGQIDYPLPGF